jgi:hypothetical protein
MVLLIVFLIFPAAAKKVDDDDIDHDAVGQCPKALFVFGASASDTGTMEAAFPFTLYCSNDFALWRNILPPSC